MNNITKNTITNTWLTLLFLGFSINSLANTHIPPEKADKYVGYWANAMEGAGKGNYIKEVSPVSNLAHVVGVEATIKSKIDEAIRHNMVVMVSTALFLYEWKTVDPQADYQNRFQNFWNSLTDRQKKAVVGFYIVDEPFWIGSGLDSRLPNWRQVKANLSQTIKFVKSIAKDRFIATTFTFHALNHANFYDMVPSELDYIGVNCYSIFGNNCTTTKIENYLSKLNHVMSRVHPHQKLIVTMDITHSRDGRGIDASLEKRAYHWKRMLSKYLYKLKLITPFIYQNVPQDGNILGAESFHRAATAIEFYMLAHLKRARCSVDDIVFGYRGDSIDAEQQDDARYCQPKCEGDDFVRRDVLGQEIERWQNAPICP